MSTLRTFGHACRYCRTPRNVFHVGDGVHYELPCAFPGCDDSVPGDAYKVLTPFGFGLFDRHRAFDGPWRWEVARLDGPAPTPVQRPVEGDGWITVHP
jgi:hypothetical protein